MEQSCKHNQVRDPACCLITHNVCRVKEVRLPVSIEVHQPQGHDDLDHSHDPGGGGGVGGGVVGRSIDQSEKVFGIR